MKGRVLDVAGATLWMSAVPALLFWLPGFGGFVGGIAGGRAAGGVVGAMLAWVCSSLLVTLLLSFAATAIDELIAFGFLAGAGAALLALIDAGGRLLGALIGGLLA